MHRPTEERRHESMYSLSLFDRGVFGDQIHKQFMATSLFYFYNLIMGFGGMHFNIIVRFSRERDINVFSV